MKKFLLSTSILAFLMSGCLVVHHDNGKHKGWYKSGKTSKTSKGGKAKTGNPGNGNGNKKFYRVNPLAPLSE